MYLATWCTEESVDLGGVLRKVGDRRFEGFFDLKLVIWAFYVRNFLADLL